MKQVLNELKVIIKRDLMKKMGTSIAFNVLDQWWEEAETQSKVSFLISIFDIVLLLLFIFYLVY